MKTIYRLVVMMVAVVVLLMLRMPAQASEIDERIESTARNSYVFRTFLQDDDIKIKSIDGSVTLAGIVADNFNKSLAQETLAGMPGVKNVDNRLEVKGVYPTVNSDAWLRDKVKATLLFHSSVNGLKIEVNVKDGIVNLRGGATSIAQKELAAEYAKDVEGVKGVNNEMILIKAAKKTQTVGQKIDDASITAQVKLSLLYHRSTSAINTKVVTNNGDVTLYGKTGSVADKNLATKIASDVNGVNSVNNRMIIE
ncbi:MAG: transport-associated protein [Deltaproteobacteria bacterium HGW-Deltaproteobacteria-2]|nr:MAG: transport-associated protein [Deltaproteobacteria bacterium HGW-Deltaproteobacteria-2]